MSLPHDQLPNETWVTIFGCLPVYPSPDKCSDAIRPIQEYPIQRMSQTCKRMRAIALPFMFSDIYLTTPTSVTQTASRMELHPDLIPHVRRLDIYVQAILGDPRTVDHSDTDLERQRHVSQEIFGITFILTEYSPLTTVNYYGDIPIARMRDRMTQFRLAFKQSKDIFERELLTHLNSHQTSRADEFYVQNILSHCCAVEQIRLQMLASVTLIKAYAFPHSLSTLYVHHVHLSPDIYAAWLSQLTSLKFLHISHPRWPGADFTSLIAAFEKFGPNLTTLVIDEDYMTVLFEANEYFKWAAATTDMVKRCSTLTKLRLGGFCYRADIVRDLPKTLVSLTMDQMQFGAGHETMSYADFVDGLLKLPKLKTLDVSHNYSVGDNDGTEFILKEHGVQTVVFQYWPHGDSMKPRF
ncbi:hypothetical protein BD410DRAFT_789084 [Rickenella mellea]|uniref:F-box domain-containing protein n=1 Tax=Rickenella mellea TaxID=50990 RepID=A0A4Y7Q2X9_9AGAM|nr:hypothetical protein BD410DRAFT_789084 [Rickenella mellea]